MTEKPPDQKRSNMWLAVAGLVALLGLGYCSSGGGNSSRELTVTEAQVVCERRVKEAAGDIRSFRHGVSTEVAGGFEVLGRATTPVGEIGYVCVVTGESGATTSTVELTP